MGTHLDRPGRNCTRYHLHRLGRLTKSIQLSPEELHSILLYINHKENNEGIYRVSKKVFAYVPRKFESTVVSEQSARVALEKALIRNFFRHIPA